MKQGFLKTLAIAAALLLVLTSFHAMANATAPEKNAETAAAKPNPMAEKWGIQIGSIRLTGADLMLDFRYRVKDPQKAGPILKRGKEVYLIDQTTGEKLAVPTTKVGPMRATTVEPKAGRQYTILFSNLNKIVKRGSKVTVVIGEFKAENLVVE